MIPITPDLPPITLEEMSCVKLMNRTDTKFVTDRRHLQMMLDRLKDDYFMQVKDGEFLADYHTLYYDTPDNKMYVAHQNGKKTRQKLRIRSYVSSEDHFLEVKTKNNHGKTKKKRIALNCIIGMGSDMGDNLMRLCRLSDHREFLQQRLWLANEPLLPKLENRFHRLTLVNRQKTERLTIDCDIQFRNFESQQSITLDDIVIIELKRDSLQPSPVLPVLNELRIFPMGFSKYCIGMAITNPKLKRNRFKERIIRINQIIKAANE